MIKSGNLNAFNNDVNLRFYKNFKSLFSVLKVILETTRLKQTLKDVDERHQEFIEMEKKIEEIRDLMLEMQSAVYDQVIKSFE